jgi:hypothetical protein
MPDVLEQTWAVQRRQRSTAIFAHGAYGRMLAAGIRTIVTCNTVPHPSNAIDVHDLLAAAAGRQLSRAAARIPVGSW